MTKQRFNEAELYLLKELPGVCRLQESMDKLREKYAQIFSEILNVVQENHPELDYPVVQVVKHDDVGIAKQTWPSMYPAWPSGFWLDHVDLKNLASEDEDAPQASIWIKPARNIVDLQLAAEKLTKAIERERTSAQLKWWPAVVRRAAAYVGYSLPESREKLLIMLQTNNGREFVDCMIGHFETLAKFIPAVDDIFQSNAQKRK